MRERIVRVWFRAEACLFSVVLKGRAGGCGVGDRAMRDRGGRRPRSGGVWAQFGWEFLRFVSYPQIRWSKTVLNRC